MNLFVLDEMVETRFSNALPEGIQFINDAIRQQFDPAIGQIAHCSGHIKTICNPSHRIAKPDALNLSGIKNI